MNGESNIFACTQRFGIARNISRTVSKVGALIGVLLGKNRWVSLVNGIKPT